MAAHVAIFLPVFHSLTQQEKENVTRVGFMALVEQDT